MNYLPIEIRPPTLQLPKPTFWLHAKKKKRTKCNKTNIRRFQDTLPNVPTIIVTPLDPQDATKLILGSSLFKVTKHA
jgi:hypothetical protein